MQDFVQRYDRGSPYDGFSGQEALHHHDAVASRLPPEQYQLAAEEAFARMSPQDRLRFGQMLQQQSRRQDFNFPDLNGDGIDDRLQAPRMLAQVTTRMQQQQPGILGQLLGGAGGGGPGLGGVASQGASMLDNPLAKAAMGGIAAIAMQQLMNRR